MAVCGSSPPSGHVALGVGLAASSANFESGEPLPCRDEERRHQVVVQPAFLAAHPDSHHLNANVADEPSKIVGSIVPGDVAVLAGDACELADVMSPGPSTRSIILPN
jgi:hypothetical protein